MEAMIYYTEDKWFALILGQRFEISNPDIIKIEKVLGRLYVWPGSYEHDEEALHDEGSDQTAYISTGRITLLI